MEEEVVVVVVVAKARGKSVGGVTDYELAVIVWGGDHDGVPCRAGGFLQ